MPSFLSELLATFRLPRKALGFTLTVVAVLALGVGANTAIFSVIDAVLLHPFPYTDSPRIVFLGTTRIGDSGNNRMAVTYPDFRDFRSQAKAFDYLAYAGNRDFTLTQVADPANLPGAIVSATVWPLLGVRPMLGRVFTDAEDGPAASPVCVLSASAWREHFGADPSIVGRPITLDQEAYTVVGVMPPRFKFWAGQVWVPAGHFADTELMRSRVIRMNTWMVGKLHPGVSLKEGVAELSVIAARIARDHPDTNKELAVSGTVLSDSVTGPLREPLLILLGAVGCVLLIACANVANLMLARNAARQREFAVRAALGAGRWRLVRQVVLESVPLALLGAGAGLLVGSWGLRALIGLLPSDVIPAEAEIAVNVPVMLCTLAASVGTMLVFSLLPAWELYRADVNEGLKEGGRGSAGPRGLRLRAALIVAEFSLSLILLAGAGLLLRSFARLAAVDPGFRVDHLLSLLVRLPESRYPNLAHATRFADDVVARLKKVPGVKAAAATTNAPFLGGMNMPLLLPGVRYTSLYGLKSVEVSAVSTDYFAAQGLRLVSGRPFSAEDRSGSEPVVILSEEAVKRYLPGGRAPLDQRVMLGLPDNLNTPGLLPAGFSHFAWSRVVGVVASAHYGALDGRPNPAAYIPLGQNWDSPAAHDGLFFLVRTEGDPAAIGAHARAAIRAIDPEEPITRMEVMERVVDDTLRQPRFLTVLLGLFAGVASGLAAVGIYGVVAWNVTRRTRELGIRSALGATRSDVVRLVLRQSMQVVLLGIGIGLAGAFALGRLLRSLLFETSATDPWTLAAVVAGLGAVGLVASFLPALRASRVSPLEAIRTE